MMQKHKALHPVEQAIDDRPFTDFQDPLKSEAEESSKEFAQIFKNNLLCVMESWDISIPALASIVSLTSSGVYKWVRGETIPSLMALYPLARFINRPIYLFLIQDGIRNSIPDITEDSDSQNTADIELTEKERTFLLYFRDCPVGVQDHIIGLLKYYKAMDTAQILSDPSKSKD